MLKHRLHLLYTMCINSKYFEDMIYTFCYTNWSQRGGNIVNHGKVKEKSGKNENFKIMATLTITMRHIRLWLIIPCRVGLVISVSASHTVGREFASRPAHTKDHYKNGKNSLQGMQCVRVGVWQCNPTVYKGQVVCGTVSGDMHLKDLLASFVRVGYRISIPDFYLVLYMAFAAEKSTIVNGLIYPWSHFCIAL